MGVTKEGVEPSIFVMFMGDLTLILYEIQSPQAESLDSDDPSEADATIASTARSEASASQDSVITPGSSQLCASCGGGLLACTAVGFPLLRDIFEYRWS